MKSSTLTSKLALALSLTLTLLHPNTFTNAQTIKATSLETCTDNPNFTFGSYPSNNVEITRTCEWIVESGNMVQIQVRRSSWCNTVHTSSSSKIQDECPIACNVPKCRKTTFDLNVCSTYEDLWSQDLKNTCAITSSNGSTSCECTDAMNKIEQGIINCNDINTKCPTGCDSCNLCLKVFSTCLVGNQSKITPSPTSSPSVKPTNSPSVKPSNSPTSSPTSSSSPTIEPTSNPTSSPTSNPTSSPTASPTASPTIDCTGMTISNDENNELLLYGNSDDADGIIKIGYQLDIELNDTNPILVMDDSSSSTTADTTEMNNMTSSETNSTSTSRTTLDEKTDMVLNTTTLSFILKDITDQITSLIVSDLFTECSSDSSSASRKRRTTTSAATTLTTAISTETTKREVSIRRNREQLERRQSQETPLSSISFDNIGIIGLSATNGQILPEESCSNEQYESGTTCVVVGSEISLFYKFINNNDKLSTGDLEKEAEMKGQTFSAISAFVSQLNDDNGDGDGDGSGSRNGLYSVKSVKEVKEETNKEDKDDTIPIYVDETDPEEDVTGLSGLYIFLIAGGASFCIMAFGFFAVRRRKQQRLSDRKHANNSSFSELSKIDPMQDDSKEDDSNEDDDSKLEVKIVDVGYSIDNENDAKIEKQKIFAIDEESMIIHNLVDQSTSSNQDLNLEDKKRFSVEGWANRVNVARDYFKNQSGLLKSDTSTISSMGWKDDSNMTEMGADFSPDSFKHRMSIARNLIDSPARSTRSNRKNDDNGSPSTLGTQIASISSSSDRVKVARSFILGSSDGSVESGEYIPESKEENRVKHVSASSNDITQTISPKKKKDGDDAAQDPLNNSEKNIDIIIKNKEWENQAEDASPSDDNDTQSASLEESREEGKLEHFSKSSDNYSPMLSLSSSERLKIARSALLRSGDLVLESRAQSKREAGQENKGHQ